MGKGVQQQSRRVYSLVRAVRIVKDGYPYIGYTGGLGLASLVGVAAGVEWLIWPAAIMLFLAAFIAFFFRDPEREIPQGAGLIVSPADGLVVSLKPYVDDTGAEGTRVSIFLSVFDVHVNRSPIGGELTASEYRPGKFLAASLERASQENEQQEMTVEGREGRIVFRMIAGLIARRIVTYKQAGESVERGERVGLIKFGSRVDLMLPAGVKVMVRRGQRVRGGSTVIGRAAS